MKDILKILMEQGAEGIHEKAKFKEVSPDELDTVKGICQPKWDGWFVVCYVKDNIMKKFSRSQLISETKTNMPNGIWKGEWVANTNWSYNFLKGKYHDWIVFYDYETFEDNVVEYKDKLQWMEQLVYPEKMRCIKTYWHLTPQEAFDRAVKFDYEGIVIVDGEYKIKCKRRFTKDYFIMGFGESEAISYKGCMIKSIIYGDGKNVIGRTSGISNEMRKEFYNNKKKYIGKVIEVGGKGLFKTGALRHPKFIRLREDKITI